MPTIYIYAFVFVAVLLIVDTTLRALGTLSKSRREVNDRLSRLNEGGGDQTAIYNQLLKDRSAMDGLRKTGPVAWLKRMYRQSGLRISFPRRILYTIAFVVGGWFLVGLLIGGGIVQLLLGPVVGLGVMIGTLLRIRTLRLKKFGAQLPVAIEIIVRSLNAGHPLPTAIALVGREMPDPIGSEFGILSDQLTFGSELDDAMLNMLDRVGSEELGLVAVTVSVQRGTGGNLAEILENLSTMIRDRGMIRAKIRAISAEGRITSVIMAAFPFGLYTMIVSLVPTYFDPIWESGHGPTVVIVLLALMSFGMLMLNRLVRFDF